MIKGSNFNQLKDLKIEKVSTSFYETNPMILGYKGAGDPMRRIWHGELELTELTLNLSKSILRFGDFGNCSASYIVAKTVSILLKLGKSLWT